MVTSEEEGRGERQIGGREWEVQALGCKTDSRMYVQHREYSQFAVTVNGK